jgi:ABC-2 type transport system ATP-binding protein
MCDTIVIINQGQAIICEKTSDLLSQLDSKEITFTLDSDLGSIPKLIDTCQVELFESHQLKFPYASSKVPSGEMLSTVSDAGLIITYISTNKTKREDTFVKLTKDGTNPQ